MANPRQFYAIKNALTKKEKDLIAFYELQWFLRKRVPTIEEVAKQLKISQTSVNYYLTRTPVVKALDQRGITNWRQHTQEELTSTQVAVAVVMMNFADTRSNEEKLDQLGVNPQTYYAWMNDPTFKNLLQVLEGQNLENIRPAAIAEFTKKIHAGDWNAVKYYLDITGALQNDQPQTEELLRSFVEIIQRHVKDPEVIMAIAQDLKLASANRTLEVVATPQQIESFAVEYDPELEDAKKKLGVV